MKYIVDTNTLIKNPNIIKDHNVVLLSHVLREFENLELKYGNNSDLLYKIRNAKRCILENNSNIEYDLNDYNVYFDLGVDGECTDNKIIQCCIDNNYGLITGDLLLQAKANMYNIPLIKNSETNDIDDNYCGVKEVCLTKKELDEINQDLKNNRYNLLANQYLIIRDSETNEEVDAYKWNGEYLSRVSVKGFTTDMFRKFRPYDKYQQVAVDSIMSNDITFIKGRAGSGKSLISLYTSWNLIEKGKYDKLIIFSNPTKARHAQELGFYKGTRTEKLIDSQIGIMLSSKFGSREMLDDLIQSNVIEILPFSDIRGFDTSGDNKTIVWITEAQNLNTDLLKLGLQRIGNNTKVIVDGDVDAQVDAEIYKIDNGVRRMSQVFRGKNLYGEVELKNIYRSKIAEISDMM